MKRIPPRLRTFLKFWYEFVVGDDWRVAVGVGAGLAATDLISGGSMDAWWIMPALVALLLGWSLIRAVRRA